ncbi:FAD-dependent oxidoreductase [Antrihabitans sp. YC2-6]|uniref:FAD-dependent oxidoreductase n=1 Tax=Antrihabitans sp. YC2-6 TaxID=2799498 RepID=UPI0018F2F69E|nr:FAD-dependent oxidoreductase [Antrihabitans sp. YC2-6]MBJ8348806.1 FAD-dependent oxidoreductase [Antrihabitans sp. YC2-6]
MNPSNPVVEIREWGRRPRRIELSGPILVGRDCAGENLADTEVSREHLRIVPSPTALSVVDLGSRNGTTLNGVALHGRADLRLGDVLRLGHSEIIVISVPTVRGAEKAAPEPESDHDSTRLGIRVGAPPPPRAAVEPTRMVALAERVLGIDPTGKRELFPAYTDLPKKLPLLAWQAIRVVSILTYLFVIVLLFVRPAAGLFIFFGVIVPVLPALFLVAPGLWRNICPLAATNQIPRVLGFTRALNPPDWVRNRGYLVAMALFFGIAGSRLAGLDQSAAATGVVLALVATVAFTGGYVFKGKSGWCSSICPLFPLQRAYAQTPFVTVPNSHCPSCVGCAKNCYDFKPRAAYQADLVDPDRSWTAQRKLFVAALPGFILGFFTAVGQDLPALEKYGLLGLFVLVSVGSYFAIEAVSPLSPAMVAIGYAAAALNIFYWFVGPVVASSFAEVTGIEVAWLRWLISTAVAVVTLLWIARTRVTELQFAWTSGTRTDPVRLLPLEPVAAAGGEGAARVRFGTDGVPVAAEVGTSLLEIAEKNKQPIEAGCRMGVCGADPVAVLDGMSCLSAPEQDEQNTLRRLGLGKTTRMACCARIESGTVTMSLTPEPGDGAGAKPTRYDRSIVSVVVIGGGIAAVTAADFVRRGHPDCEIHLVGRESHALYNRMGISRLVYGRSAMQGLYLLPEQWYDDHGVHAWLNTMARRIDVPSQRVLLGTGEALPYDRLILAMGSSATVPPTPGLDREGSFVLREAGDAMRIRAYAQQHDCRRAVVAGGGLLGLEAAYSLHLLGLQVTVLERGDRLLSRQIDPRCSEHVAQHFKNQGIEILRRAETDRVVGAPGVTGALLKDGRELPCDVFLTAVGVRPNADLAREAGIPVGKGVLVDDRMRTRTRWVYAAGDVAEHDGHVWGLWPVAVEQAEAAAVNALGGEMVLTSETPATILKGVDLELFSIGKVTPAATDEVIVIDRPARRSYRRLILTHGRVVGATVLGHHPADVTAAQKAVKSRTQVAPTAVNALRAGDWSVLAAERSAAR